MPYYYWSKKMLALFLNLRGSKYIFLLKKKKNETVESLCSIITHSRHHTWRKDSSSNL